MASITNTTTTGGGQSSSSCSSSSSSFPGKNWKIHQVIPQLKKTTLLKLGHSDVVCTIDIICKIIQNDWIVNFCGKQQWSSFLNSRAIVKEIEDAVMPITYVLRILRQKDIADINNNRSNYEKQDYTNVRKEQKLNNYDDNDNKTNNNYTSNNRKQRTWTVLDLCSGKGFFATLLSAVMSYHINNHPDDDKNNGSSNNNIVNKIIMVDNDLNINWNHIDLLNSTSSIKTSIETHRLCLYSKEFDVLINSLLDNNVFVIGTHLCKRLSARAVEVYNALCNNNKYNNRNNIDNKNSIKQLSTSSMAFLLAPCCLPVFRGICYIQGCNSVDDDSGIYPLVNEIKRLESEIVQLPGLKFQSIGENLLYLHVCWLLLDAENNDVKIKLSSIAEQCSVSLKAVKRVAYKGLKKGELNVKNGCWSIKSDIPSLSTCNDSSGSKGKYARMKANFFANHRINVSKKSGTSTTTTADVVAAANIQLYTQNENTLSIDLFNLGIIGKKRPFLNWVQCLAKAINTEINSNCVEIIDATLFGKHQNEQLLNGNLQGERRSSWIICS